MKRVLVVDNYDSFVYNLVQILREDPLCSFEVVTNDRIPFNRLDEFDYLLLSPGPGIPEEAGDLLALIDRCYRSHAILGVCLGHQAIGQYFGAKLEQMSSPKHGHPSTLQIRDHQDRLYKQVNEPIQVGRYHSWLLSQSRSLTVYTLLPRMKKDISCLFPTSSYPSMAYNSIPNQS